MARTLKYLGGPQDGLTIITTLDPYNYYMWKRHRNAYNFAWHTVVPGEATFEHYVYAVYKYQGGNVYTFWNYLYGKEEIIL